MFARIRIWTKRLGQAKRRPLTLKLLPVSLLLAAGVAGGQQDFSKVQIKVTKVAGTVYMLEGAGGNIGVSVGEDGVVLVDDQFAPLAPKIREALKGITDKPIKFVLNTHFHGDHTGGKAPPGNAERFARKHGTPRFFTDYGQLLAQPDIGMVTSDLWRPDR
jgi:glyoxylase-like metal-dependent hydrolase (beta-lactamase superfamily II)